MARWVALYGALVALYIVAVLLVPVHVLGYALALAAAVAWVLFVVVYGFGVVWYESTVGRNYLGLALVIASTMTFVAVRLTVNGAPPAPDPSADAWRVAIYTAVAVFGVRHLYDTVGGQLRGRAERLARRRGE